MIEFIDFCIILSGVFVLGVTVMYGKAIYYNIEDWLAPQNMAQKQALQALEHKDAEQKTLELSLWAQKIDSYVAQLSDNDARSRARINNALHRYDLEEYTKRSLSPGQFTFSLLPPGKWLVVSAIDLRAPIIDISYASPEKIEKGDFYTELEQGVVKYPYTASAGEMGNMVVFGHSSTEMRDKNKYGYIFQKISKLNPDDKIQVFWDGQVFEYSVQSKVVKRPKDVAAELNQYKKGKFLTLMACRPLFSDLERIMVVAESKDPLAPQLSKM